MSKPKKSHALSNFFLRLSVVDALLLCVALFYCLMYGYVTRSQDYAKILYFTRFAIDMALLYYFIRVAMRSRGFICWIFSCGSVVFGFSWLAVMRYALGWQTIGYTGFYFNAYFISYIVSASGLLIIMAVDLSLYPVATTHLDSMGNTLP